MRKLLTLLGALPILVNAQDTNLLNTFTISDNRIETNILASGRNVQVMTRQEIQALPVQSTQDLLQYISGVDLRQRGAWGAQADVSLRGGTFDQTLILVNGIKMNDPQTGHHSMNLGIDLGAIQRIEVIKGPAAARYGLNAFSGVINIITSPEAENAVMAGMSIARSVDVDFPEENWTGYQVSGSAHLGTEASRHLVGVQSTQSNGYRPNTDLDRTSLSYLSSTETAIGTLKAMGSILRNRFGASGYYAFPIDSSSEEGVDTYMGALIYEQQFGSVGLKGKLYSRKNFDTYTLFRRAPEIYQNKHRTDVEGAEVHASVPSKLGMSGVGLEYRREAISSTNLGRWLREYAGLFAEHRVSLFNERLAVQGGAYLNYLKDDGFQFLPSASLTYQLFPGANLFGNVGRSFRMPTFTDLYYVGPTNLGNEDLKPEQSVQYEAGAKYGMDGHLIQASAFYQESTDLIDWVRADELAPWVPTNQEAVATQGVELSYSLTQRLVVVEDLLHVNMLRIGYTWLNMERLQDETVLSRYAFNQLRHQVVAQASLTFKEHWAFIPSIRFNDRVAYQDYALFDARIQFTQERFKLWIDGSNLLDTEYTEAANAPMPGRWLRLGVEVKLH